MLLSTTFAQATLYYNGKIFSGDASHALNNYFIVDQGTITQTGANISQDSILKFKDKVNLNGKTVLPGFIDSHIHFIDGSLGLLQISLYDVTDPARLKQRLQDSKGSLLDGIYVARDLGFEALKGVESPLQLLDEVFPDVPAVVFLKSGHAAIANSKGLKKLGFTQRTSIKDGTIEQDKNGNLNGWLLEAAAMEASKQIGSAYSAQTIREAIGKGQSLALSYGITTIGDNTFSPYHLKIYQELQRKGDLKMRFWARSYGRILETDNLMSGLGVQKLGFIGPKTDFSRVHYHAIKLFEDMSLSVSQSVTGVFEPGGTVFLNHKQIKDYFLLHPNSVFAFHVQGKKGLQNIIDAVDEIGERNKNRRHVIDHAGYAGKEQLERINQLGLSLTILASQTFDYPALIRDYTRHAPAFQPADLLNVRMKYQLAHGALTSDFPYGMDTLFATYRQVDGLNPFPNMAVNITGKFPDGKAISGFENKTLDAKDAVQAYTSNGAYVIGLENKIGKIAPGYKADFIVMQEDLFSQDPMQWYNSRVEQTFIQGEKVFDRNKAVAGTVAEKAKNVKPFDYAISPIFGYDPTVGFIYGAATFLFPLQTPGNYFDLQLQETGKGNTAVSSTYMRYGLANKLDFKLPVSYSNFVQYYFGEGDNTSGDSYNQLFSRRYYARPELILSLKHEFKIDLFADFRGREEIKMETKNGEILNSRLFPDENTLAFGAGIFWDTRDNTTSTKKGLFVNTALEYIPASLNVANTGQAAFLSMDIRYFHYIYTSKFVFASRVSGGATSGTSSYLFRYTLGGSNLLRGYYSNRFRGEKYYAGQAELRFPLYGKFSGAAFFDCGDITDDAFHTLQSTYGGGIRFSIRDNVVLRLDYGFGKDQEGLFFTFGEAF